MTLRNVLYCNWKVMASSCALLASSTGWVGGDIVVGAQAVHELPQAPKPCMSYFQPQPAPHRVARALSVAVQEQLLRKKRPAVGVPGVHARAMWSRHRLRLWHGGGRAGAPQIGSASLLKRYLSLRGDQFK